jgi:hypothetical protein
MELRIQAAKHAVATYPKNLPAGASVDDLDSDGADRLAIVVNKRWGPSVDLTVGFLDNPDRELRDKILAHLNAWARDAAVRFHEVDTDAAVRIGRFTDYDMPGFGGYWSYVGTDIEFIARDQPTMNFERFTATTPDSELYRVVRHEAGHTLGFPHEHMRRELVERLDREKVIAAYRVTQGWSEQEVIDQVLTPLEEASIFGTELTDETSIMCYEIEGELTLDGVPIIGGVDINESDHRFASPAYHRDHHPLPCPRRGTRCAPSQPAARKRTPIRRGDRHTQTGRDQFIRSAGLATLRLTTPTLGYVQLGDLRTAPSELALAVSDFEALRAFGGRSVRQLLALPWQGDPTPLLPAFTQQLPAFTNGGIRPPTADLFE